MRKKVCIALVANSSWNVLNFRLKLIEQLQAAGFQVLVLTPDDAYAPHLKRLPELKWAPIRHLRAAARSPWKDLRFTLELYRYYKKYGPIAVLHFTIKPNIYGSLAARWASVPAISTLTGLGYSFIHASGTQRLISWLYKQALKSNAKVLFHNPDDARLFMEQALVEIDQVMVVGGSGVDMNYFHPQEKEESSAFTFLMIARALYDKGILEFMEAARELHHTHPHLAFKVVGDTQSGNPSAVSQAEMQAWKAEGLVHFPGHVDDVRPFIREADVVVLPSYREGLPRAILEAMSMGKPIITTDVPGCRETVEEGKNGFLVEVKNSKALAEAMRHIKALPPVQLRQMGEASRAICRAHFEVSGVNQKYLEVIQDIMKPSDSAS